MTRPLMWLILATWLLTGCDSNRLSTPYTMWQPRTGATVTCGHWVWWECQLIDYKAHGYRRLQASQ